MRSYPEVWPTRQKIGFELDNLFYTLKPLIRRASKRKWGNKWLEAATQYAVANHSYRRNRTIELDLQLCLILAKNYWNLPQIEQVMSIRHRWAHQREFSKSEYEQAVKHIDGLVRLLSAEKAAGEKAA